MEVLYEHEEEIHAGGGQTPQGEPGYAVGECADQILYFFKIKEAFKTISLADPEDTLTAKDCVNLPGTPVPVTITGRTPNRPGECGSRKTFLNSGQRGAQALVREWQLELDGGTLPLCARLQYNCVRNDCLLTSLYNTIVTMESSFEV